MHYRNYRLFWQSKRKFFKLNNFPENAFWEVETSSLRDFPQQFRTFDIRRNSDNNISIIITNVDPAVSEGSTAAKSRGYAIGAARLKAQRESDDQAMMALEAPLRDRFMARGGRG